MTHIEPGQYGAKRATWRDTNPRNLLRNIIEKDVTAGEKVWREEFWQKVTKRASISNNSYLFAVVQYWLDNNIRSLLLEIRGQNTRKAKKTETQTELVQVAQTTETILLMRLPMPNGKLLGECTGAECQRFGGWYARIAKLVPARKIVSDVLNEDKLHELWDAR